MLASDFGINNSVNLCESCHHKLRSCPTAVVVYGSKVVEVTGIPGICMCTEYDPALILSRVPVYRDIGVTGAKTKSKTKSKTKTKTKDNGK